jgi:hypothetical protein
VKQRASFESCSIWGGLLRSVSFVGYVSPCKTKNLFIGALHRPEPSEIIKALQLNELRSFLIFVRRYFLCDASECQIVR